MRTLTLHLLPKPAAGTALDWLDALPWPAATLAYADRHAHRREEVLLGRWLLAAAASPDPGAAADAAAIAERPEGGVIPRPGWHGAIAHSGGWLAVVASPDGRCGVDIEAVRRLDYLALARHGFSAGDADAVRDASGALPEECFYRCWTLREAGFKAGLRGAVQGAPDALPELERGHAACGRQGQLYWAVVAEGAVRVEVRPRSLPDSRPGAW